MLMLQQHRYGVPGVALAAMSIQGMAISTLTVALLDGNAQVPIIAGASLINPLPIS